MDKKINVSAITIAPEKVDDAAKALREIARELATEDPEEAHNKAIEVLKNFLIQNGMQDLVAAYDEANEEYWNG